MLTDSQIIALLETLHEHTMAREIFVPTFNAMGMQGVRYTGGPGEEGIDVEYYELTEPEKRKSYVGIQFKKGDLTYGAGGNKGTVKEIRNQAEEAFEKEIVDVDGHGTHTISRFIAAVTGSINEPARKYIGKARHKGTIRGIDFWEGDKLVGYIRLHWMAEFELYFADKIDSVQEEEEEEEAIVDSDYIKENFPRLVKQCGAVRSTISGIEWDIVRAVVAHMTFRNDYGRVPMADVLLEIGHTEDYIERELSHLVSLDYLDIDEYGLKINGHAEQFRFLADSICRELEDAEEDAEQAEEVFNEVIGS